ncbi:AtpZ/AtpI family protein [Cytophagaceae bacterium ABcell3]|nr:AtpZ/AtpI family protein [Cytophagaceae bacterium ABcell3]
MSRQSNNRQSQKKRPLEAYIKYSGLAMQMIMLMLIAVWAGSKLDAYFEVKNRLFTIFLLLFSVIGSVYLVIKSLLNNK